MTYTWPMIIIHGVIALGAVATWLESRNNKKHIVNLKVSVNGRIDQALKAEYERGKVAGRAEHG